MSDKNTTVVRSGGCLGNILALALSFYINKSVGWALLHGVFGYFYIVYAILTGQVFK